MNEQTNQPTQPPEIEVNLTEGVGVSLPPPPPLPLQTPAGFVLTPEQAEGVERISSWLNADVLLQDLSASTYQFKLGGYAGTGKTTIIKTIISELRRQYNIVVCAFTGKACHVLQRKGISAQTMHSLMYQAEADPDNPASMIFHKRDKLEGLPDLVIVDEASMVSTELYNDLCSFNIPMLFVGDPGQLEPVGDNPNLMKEPDYVLKTIHRQAEGNPIITLAQAIRTGGPLKPTVDDGRLYVDYKTKNLNTEWLKQADQVICARNKTKAQLNQNFRKMHGFPDVLNEGDKIIVLRNNLNYGVFNGMILSVDEIKNDNDTVWWCNCLSEDGKKYFLPIWKRGFDPLFDAKMEKVSRRVVYCDYGYCITAHKSQGSEWKHVHVIDEWMPPQVWSMQRWRYTAITRAAERLVYSF